MHTHEHVDDEEALLEPLPRTEGAHKDPHDRSGHAHRHEPAPGASQLVLCPVMPGNLVNPAEAESEGLYREYQGTRYWFCCTECRHLWDAQPATYAAAA